MLSKPSRDSGTLAFGVDGTPEAALLIQAGAMTATSLQSAQDLAELNLTAVHDLLNCEEDEVNVDVGNPLITQERPGVHRPLQGSWPDRPVSSNGSWVSV